ncbi:hypothetical protein [Urbifossiella limnaea]|uniref:Uncharacterized protein n=1 Tax=Urbifossiella limnaea TaxID=2528023 RepID=A0A517Y3J4_9BACT|nr:hypothetical protein [Urbifossiella limnaea]QDU24282.1 hypothetical protein ETAA1_62960 [Urbifossiella limnaea]
MAFLFLVVAVLVISVVVGVIAQFLNKLNEAAAQPAARPNGPRPPAGGAPAKDMDRFLAEIDRLRRKAAAEAAGEQPPPKPAAAPRPAPVTPAGVRPQDAGRGRDPDREREQKRERYQEREQERNQDRSQDRPKARPADRAKARPAARTEPAPAKSRRIEQPGAPLATPVAPGTLSPGRVEELPVAPVVSGPASATGAAAATRVTRIAERPRPVAKTDFAKNLTALLGSGQGAAAAVVLGEIFGPPKSRRRG